MLDRTLILLIFISFCLIPLVSVAQDEGSVQGSLFSMPEWLYNRMDQNYMSKVLDSSTSTMGEGEEPSDYYSIMKSAESKLQAGDYQEALRTFEKAIDLNETAPEAWYGRAMALEQLNRSLSAIDGYKWAMSLTNPAADTWPGFGGIGRCSLVIYKYNDAEEAFRRAINLYEDSGADYPKELASLYSGLAEALSELSREEEAKSALQTAASILAEMNQTKELE